MTKIPAPLYSFTTRSLHSLETRRAQRKKLNRKDAKDAKKNKNIIFIFKKLFLRVLCASVVKSFLVKSK